ncbi:MAG: Transposase, Gmet_2093 family [Nitrospira sp.]|jgi:hypothetical protein|nr:Transposase, Gmet_2093 family [Nitrospira sp.]
MAFAQLTYRESLRDIEVCLSAQSAKRYHLGVQQEITRSTLADANELRDWRIYAELAQRLIVQARTLDLGESRGVALENTGGCKNNCVTGYHASSREEGGFDDQAQHKNGCVVG